MIQEPSQEPGRPTVFLSHSSNDKDFVERLAGDIEKAGIDVWYDRWEIRVGDSIVGKINAGLKDSDYVIAVISPNSVQSKWVTLEIDAALIESLGKKSSYLLPVLLADTDLPPLLRDRRYADFRRDYEQGLREVLNVLSEDASLVAKVEEIPAEIPCVLWGIKQRELRAKLNDGLDLEEVKTICFNLEIDFHNLAGAGATKNEKIMEMILFLKRRGQLHLLIKEIADMRPDLCR